MEGIEIPSYFLCPISLEIMRDPVTLPTGMTYDRQSIERWIFIEKHGFCPVTKQQLPEDFEMTPNHTLRRLIQAWCVTNAAVGIERFPTPKPPIDKAEIQKLLDQVRSPQSLMSSLKKIKLILSESERNRRCFLDVSDALDVLSEVVSNSYLRNPDEFKDTGAGEEALAILQSLQLSDQSVIDLVTTNGDFIESLIKVLQLSCCQSRTHAACLLKSIVSVVSPTRLMGLKQEMFNEVVNVLHDSVSPQATKAALKIICNSCGWGRNRIKAVDAGAVTVLIELLINENNTKSCEMIMIALDILCSCAEGRAALIGHPCGIAIVSKKIFRVSRVAGERAVRILHSVAKYSSTPGVLTEMLQVGAVAKLCMVLQFDCGDKIREKVKEILRMHSRVWRNSPCLSFQLQATYP